MTEEQKSRAVEECRQLGEADAPYWRIMADEDGSMISVCLQPLDELEYDQNRFFTKEKFPTEQAAQEAIENFELALLRSIGSI